MEIFLVTFSVKPSSTTPSMRGMHTTVCKAGDSLLDDSYSKQNPKNEVGLDAKHMNYEFKLYIFI